MLSLSLGLVKRSGKNLNSKINRIHHILSDFIHICQIGTKNDLNKNEVTPGSRLVSSVTGEPKLVWSATCPRQQHQSLSRELDLYRDIVTVGKRP